MMGQQEGCVGARPDGGSLGCAPVSSSFAQQAKTPMRRQAATAEKPPQHAGRNVAAEISISGYASRLPILARTISSAPAIALAAPTAIHLRGRRHFRGQRRQGRPNGTFPRTVR